MSLHHRSPAVFSMALEGIVFKTIDGQWILSQQTNSTRKARNLELLANGSNKINKAFPKGYSTLLRH